MKDVGGATVSILECGRDWVINLQARWRSGLPKFRNGFVAIKEPAMIPSLEPLVLDLVGWCASRSRTYQEVLEAWRTSCPRLAVWEDAKARGLVETQIGECGLEVVATEAGHRLVAADLAVKRTARPPPIAEARRS